MYFLDSGGTNIPEKKKKKKTLEDPKFLICGVFLLGSPNFTRIVVVRFWGS